jgi:hypothetical protein
VGASDVIEATRARDDEGGGCGGLRYRSRRGQVEAKRNAGEGVEKGIRKVGCVDSGKVVFDSRCRSCKNGW